MPDGAFELGSMAVRVSGGVARLADGDTIAGSTLTMDRALRWTVRDVGLDVAEACVAASLVPARVLGVSERVGTIEPGKDADLVVLDERLEVVAVMARGAWVAR
jgi:N-acetylglucosamine-6-phosphate deacetylase